MYKTLPLEWAEYIVYSDWTKDRKCKRRKSGFISLHLLCYSHNSKLLHMPFNFVRASAEFSFEDKSHIIRKMRYRDACRAQNVCGKELI